jgi:hypothetical protein
LVVDILSTGCLRNRMCVHLGLKLVHCVYNTLQNWVAETLQFSLIIEVFTDSALNQLYSVFLFWDFPDWLRWCLQVVHDCLDTTWCLLLCSILALKWKYSSLSHLYSCLCR